MQNKVFTWTVRTIGVAVLAVATCAQAQAPTPTHFSGFLNDYTAAAGIGGPWEMHGTWTLDLKRGSDKADFAVVMTMEHPDYWVIANPATPTTPPAPPATPTVDNPGLRSPHTHHLMMTDATVSSDAASLALCPADSPASTARFLVTGLADITGNGTAAPFQKSATTGVVTLSKLQVCIAGGSEVTYSNMAMTFANDSPAGLKHFGILAIHGVVRKAHDRDHDHDHDHDFDKDDRHDSDHSH